MPILIIPLAPTRGVWHIPLQVLGTSLFRSLPLRTLTRSDVAGAPPGPPAAAGGGAARMERVPTSWCGAGASVALPAASSCFMSACPASAGPAAQPGRPTRLLEAVSMASLLHSRRLAIHSKLVSYTMRCHSRCVNRCQDVLKKPARQLNLRQLLL